VAGPASAEIGTSGPEETVTASPLPTWQTNGTVWDMEIVNGVVYVGGNFTKVRPPGAAAGTNEVERLRLAAFDARTGDLLPWEPKATANVSTVSSTDKNCTILTSTTQECATVWSLDATPDGTSLIAGGDFLRIDGNYRSGVAAFSTATGALNTTFKPDANGRVYSVAARDDRVFFGGGPMFRVNGVDRSQLAAVDFPSGDLRQDWAPSVTSSTTAVIGGVRTLALTQDGSRLLVGGGFDKLNDTTIHGIGALDAETGASARWDTNKIYYRAFVTSLNVYGDTAYTTADALGSTSEGVIAYDAMTGAEQWFDSCRGASHSMAVVRGVVYAGSHAHDCGVMDDAFGENYQGYPSGDRRRYTLRAEVPAGNGRAKMLQWTPKTNDGNGARAMATDGDSLWVGGEFTTVDTLSQQGLTRFSFLDEVGVNRKPFTPTNPIVTSTRPDAVDVAFKQTEDPDNRQLEYWVIRDGKYNDPIHKVTSSGKPWLLGWHHFRDTDVKAGETHSYDIRAVDPLGVLSNRTSPVSVTVPAGFTAAQDLAVKDQPQLRYGYESLTNGRFVDSVSGRTANLGSGVGTGTEAVQGTGITLSGSSGGVVVENTRQYSTRAFAVEAMFKTTTKSGGVIASLGDSASLTGTSGTNTGNLYMDNSGRLNVGVRPDGQRTDPWQNPFNVREAITSTAAFNDGQWHHVVANFDGRSGVQLYVDGQLVAENAALNWSRAVNAYFRVGGDRVSGWPNTPSSPWFAGQVDEAALYLRPLPAAGIAEHANALLGRLAAPGALKATATSDTEVDLTWSGVQGAVQYEVERDGTVVGTADSTTFSDTGLTASTEYSYRVRAVADGTQGPWTDPVTVTTNDPPPPPPAQLFDTGSVWRFDDSGNTPAGWNTPEFDDTGWSSGPSALGQAETWNATEVDPYIDGTSTRRITTYFRNTFTVDDPSAVKSLDLGVRRDDGIVVYLNGTEVWRDNMPAGDVSADTLATTWAPDDGTAWLPATIPADLLQSGTNTIAVEVHQNARSSLDLTFDMRLTATF
jgi:hypothetical protein